MNQNINMFDRRVIFLMGGGVTKFESHSFPTFSLHCLYKKMILHLTFLSSTSLFYYYLFFNLVFEPTIVHKYQYLVLPR